MDSSNLTFAQKTTDFQTLQWYKSQTATLLHAAVHDHGLEQSEIGKDHSPQVARIWLVQPASAHTNQLTSNKADETRYLALCIIIHTRARTEHKLTFALLHVYCVRGRGSWQPRMPRLA